MLSVCVPVLKRYDLLRQLILSAEAGTMPPNTYRIIDNGRNGEQMEQAVAGIHGDFQIYVPDVPMGVAESWNWFIKNVPEERIIANDDIIFGRTSIAQLVNADGDLLWAAGCGFSCYVIRDACVDKIGLFDETISPGYGYYEDEDYLQRLDSKGTRAPSAVAQNVDCGVQHVHSATLTASSHEELLEHHRKFLIAQGNYVRKWKLEETFR